MQDPQVLRQGENAEGGSTNGLRSPPPDLMMTSGGISSSFRAASQRLGILRTSWRVFHDKLLIGRCFCSFVLPVLEYCSAVWCSADDTHLKLLDRVVSGASFLTGGVLNCDLSHRRSVAVL